MSFLEEYKQKLVSADEAVKIVKSGDWVDYGWCTGTPDALDKALARRTDELKDVNVRGGILLKHLPFSSVRMPANISHGTHGIWAVMRESLSREAVLSTHQSVTQSFLVIIEIQQHLTMSLCSRLHRWIHTVTSTLVLTHLTSVRYARLQRKSSLRSMKTCLAVTAVQKPMYIFHRFLTLLRVTTLQSESLVPVALQQM